MPVPVSQMIRVAGYVLRQKLAGEKRYPLVLMLEPLYRCNLACAGCGKIQYPASVLRTQLSAEQCMRAVGRVPGTGREHRRRRAAAPPRDRRHRGRPRRAPEVRLPLHERAVAGAQARSLHPEQVPELERPPGRARAGARLRCVSRWRLPQGPSRHPGRPGARLSRHHQHHALRRRGSGTHGGLLRRDDAPGCGGHDDLTRLPLREGGRPGALPGAGAHAPAIPAHPRRARAAPALALQPVAALPRVPGRRARLRLHALGQPHLQHLRLAEALLPAPGRPCRELPASFSGRPAGRATAPPPATPDAGIACCTAASRRAPSTRASPRCAAFSPWPAPRCAGPGCPPRLPSRSPARPAATQEGLGAG